MLAPVRAEHLIRVRLATPKSLELEFADGYCRRLLIRRLGIPVDRMRWDTVQASATGEVMTVTGIKGDAVPIDSSTLRYLVDRDYAARIEAELDGLQLTRDELKELSRQTKPPAGWTGEPEDLIRDSWK